MLKLVDKPPWGGGAGNGVLVRIQSRAQFYKAPESKHFQGFYIFGRYSRGSAFLESGWYDRIQESIIINVFAIV